jgi:hypothetical protein
MPMSKSGMGSRSATAEASKEGHTMYHWLATIDCKSTQLGVPKTKIFLPRPIRQEKSRHRPKWPADNWSAFVLCPQCRQVSAYTKPNVCWEVAPTSGRALILEFVCIEISCGQENCGLPTRIFGCIEPSNLTPTETEWVTMILTGNSNLTCPVGHSLSVPSTVKVRVSKDVSQIQP